MTDSYTPDMNAGAYEFSVVSACFDLHMYLTDRKIRAELSNPKSIRELKRAREQLDSVIRKLEFAPVIAGECREVRQDEKQHESV